MFAKTAAEVQNQTFQREGFGFSMKVFTSKEEANSFGIPKSHTDKHSVRQCVTVSLSRDMLDKYLGKLKSDYNINYMPLIHMLALDYCTVSSKAVASVYYKIKAGDNGFEVLLFTDKFPDGFIQQFTSSQNDLLTVTLNTLGHLPLLNVDNDARTAYLLAQDLYTVNMINNRINNQYRLKNHFNSLFQVCSERSMRIVSECTANSFHYLNKVTPYYHVLLLVYAYDHITRSEEGGEVIKAWANSIINVLFVDS